ncbi:vacuolar-processing enzyme-like [Amaranthus tricolor]|uniref:vacuolar-processing enzyme-like n=1 Tax=Amaranthus tricolor TaxID=29722 RepID=UPI00258B0673|nr:vacuolar-processing enzyme-like [Amaranthus tricolor]
MAMHYLRVTLLAFTLALSSIVEGRFTSEMLNYPSDGGTKWAVLIAGSLGYENYRHQADICHAYQIMRKGGMKEENIIVFMYDDIAYNEDNPKPGAIINRPGGENVYPHVPKDYTGKNVTTNNVFAVLLGNKKALIGGSGKVLKSGPKDHVFLYYADHGGPGLLAMPNSDEDIYAKDLIQVLKSMHAAKSYKTMAIYVEACESGSMFDGLLPKDLNIYVTTASNPKENSYACYCGGDPGVPPEYNNTCLGDLYSISWLEDSDKKDPRKETLEQQYTAVKKRTNMSHVMQYGDVKLSTEFLSVYFISNTSKHNQTYPPPNQSEPIIPHAIEQREADLIYFKEMVRRAPVGSTKRIEAEKRLDEVISQRKHVDESVQAIANVLFEDVDAAHSYLTMVRPAGQPLVDDWDCLKTMVKIYEAHCGHLQSYGKKYMRAFANFCNAGVHQEWMAQASIQVCAK